jgi:cold shock protein
VRQRPNDDLVAHGEVDWFDPDEGWGVIHAGEVPGGCFVHFSVIQVASFRALTQGQRVRFTYEQPGFLQDGYSYRALAVWPDHPPDLTR